MKRIYIVLVILMTICLIIFGSMELGSKKEKIYLVPLGNIVGIRANTDGILVLDNEDLEIDYVNGIEPGDNIKSIDGKLVYSSLDIKKILNNTSKNSVEVLLERDGDEMKKSIPIKIENNKPRLGIWIRDKISGIGTITFLNPKDNTFLALGHPIKDIDTNELVKIKSGKIYNAKNVLIEKGLGKKVGQIKAEIDVNKPIGIFTKNNNFGISGNLMTYNKNKVKEKMIEVCSRKDIKVGPAKILFQNKDGKIQEYKINIKKIQYNKKDDKDMVIEVVDDKLINYTGGIVQGMSGSPIIQNNKIIGAVTHVFIDNSKIGYGIFIDKMII